MGYQIQYSPQTNYKYPRAKSRRTERRWLPVFIGCICLLGIFLARKPLRSLLFPGDPEVTDAAISEMLESLRAGEGMYEAVSAFCLEVLEHEVQS